ncbi:fungal specific transcription factor domain-containing protein [Phlyctema vagabunda]|uniref:Fungal specific transcription factor domain-containing protein n=1 Tax=Phlyctema vagabunda TaxID=108571 RepID=A0ABR4PUF5_9HELO
MSKNQELLDRIARLESLITQTGPGVNAISRIEGQGNAQQTVPEYPSTSTEPAKKDGFWIAESDRPLNYTQPGPHKSNETHHSSNQFWSSLTAEVVGLKQLLDEPSEDDEEESNQSSPATGLTEDTVSSVLFNEASDYVDLRAFHPSSAHAATLCEVFFARVDMLCKILHKPTVMSSILSRAHDLNKLRYEKSLEALMFAVYFAAVTSLSSQECIKFFGQSKDVLRERYRVAASTSLNNANFLDDVDFVSLQALLLFLLCFRSGSGKRKAWTLFSLAIRIAQSLGLHREAPETIFTPFETEMRRRLWWQLCVHDVWQSEDRGMDPLITEISFSTPRPANVNDEDLDPNSLQPIVGRSEFTVMTFSIIGHEVFTLYTKLHYALSSKMRYEFDHSSWSQKQALAQDFCDRLEESVIKQCNMKDPLQWMCSRLAQNIQLKVFLVLYFPMQTLDVSRPPQVDKEVALRNGIAFLEILEDLETNTNTALWWWHLGSWIQWHPLAVVLAELCTQTEGLLVDRGWIIVNKVYEKYGERVSDAKGSRIWRPIKKLYQQANKARTEALTNTSSIPGQATFIAPGTETLHDYVQEVQISDLKTVQNQTAGMQNINVQDMFTSPAVNWDYLRQETPTSRQSEQMHVPVPASMAPQIDAIDWVIWEQFLQDTCDTQDSSGDLSKTDFGPPAGHQYDSPW